MATKSEAFPQHMLTQFEQGVVGVQRHAHDSRHRLLYEDAARHSAGGPAEYLHGASLRIPPAVALDEHDARSLYFTGVTCWEARAKNYEDTSPGRTFVA